MFCMKHLQTKVFRQSIYTTCLTRLLINVQCYNVKMEQKNTKTPRRTQKDIIGYRVLLFLEKCMQKEGCEVISTGSTFWISEMAVGMMRIGTFWSWRSVGTFRRCDSSIVLWSIITVFSPIIIWFARTPATAVTSILWRATNQVWPSFNTYSSQV